eukprot:1156449-Pelagomonas_calceolata.AAC.12
MQKGEVPSGQAIQDQAAINSMLRHVRTKESVTSMPPYTPHWGEVDLLCLDILKHTSGPKHHHLKMPEV